MVIPSVVLSSGISGLYIHLDGVSVYLTPGRSSVVIPSVVLSFGISGLYIHLESVSVYLTQDFLLCSSCQSIYFLRCRSSAGRYSRYAASFFPRHAMIRESQPLLVALGYKVGHHPYPEGYYSLGDKIYTEKVILIIFLNYS